jgi:hypothetical protein
MTSIENPSTEEIAAGPNWSSLSGVALDGGYELKRAIQSAPGSATFQVRVLGSGGLEATARFYYADPALLDEQLALWLTLPELSHPNLSIPLAAGRRRIGELETAYVVLPIPDEKLSGVLTERALDEREAIEVMESVSAALAHLHSYGFAHGCVSPETVLAVGPSVQLASENLRKLNARPPIAVSAARYLAPESVEVNSSASSDVWCLGATLFECLTREPYAPARRHEIKTLPLEALMQRCLVFQPQNRAKLPEAQSILRRGSKAALLPVDDDALADPAELAAAELAAELLSEDAGKASEAEVAAVADSEPAPEDVTSPAPVEVVSEEAQTRETSASQAEAPESPNSEAQAPATSAPEIKPTDTQTPERRVAAGVSTYAAVPPDARHKPIEGKRQPIEAKVKVLEPVVQEELALALPMLMPSERPVVRVRTPPGAWRGALAAAAGLLLLLALLWLVIIPRMQSPLGSPDAAQSTQAVPTPKQGGAWQTKTLPAPTAASPAGSSSAAKPQAAKPAPAAASAPGAVSSTDRWRVVLYSYEHQADAERRIELTNRNHPGLSVYLFAPKPTGPFMILTGSSLSHEAALALRTRVMRMGLPRAIYVQEF